MLHMRQYSHDWTQRKMDVQDSQGTLNSPDLNQKIDELANAVAYYGGAKGKMWLVEHGYMTMPSPGEFKWKNQKDDA